MRLLRSVAAATMVALVGPSLACTPECDAGYGLGCGAAMTKNKCGECVITAEKYRAATCESAGGYGGGGEDAVPDTGADADADADADAGSAPVPEPELLEEAPPDQ